MWFIDNVVVPSNIHLLTFKCPYQVCRGKCCVVGDAGAPLNRNEVEIIKASHGKIESLLPEQNKQYFRKSGPVVIEDGILSTPCIDDTGACIYFSDKNKKPKCLLESISVNGSHRTLRPLSCRLFPIRIREANGLVFLDYEVWKECDLAWANKEMLLIEFLKEPLIDRFGREWYERLEQLVRKLMK